MSKKITAIYCRISTVGQKMDSQVDELTKWIEVHQPVNIKWYKDSWTGTTMERPAMSKLLADLQKGNLCTIVVWRLDRLGRTASGLTALFEELSKFRCNLISLRDSLDLSTPSGRLNANIIASVAAYETEIRAERVKAGQESAKIKGKKWGGSKKGVRKGKVEGKINSVLALFDQGISKAEISRTVGISIPTINSIIKNRDMQKTTQTQ